MDKIDLMDVVDHLMKENKIFPTYDNYSNAQFSTKDLAVSMKEAIHQALVLASENATATVKFVDYDDAIGIVDKQSVLDVEKLIM